MRPLLLALSLLLVAPVGAAQTLDLEAGTLTVTGSATVTAPPDRAVIRLGVQTRASTAAEALSQHEEDVARVLRQVRTFGVPDRRISIEGLNLGENYGPNGIDGYQATRIVSVETDSLAVVPSLIASVVEVGANRLDGLFYTLSETAAVQDRALNEAMTRARAKALLLASAAGYELGPVVAVLEQGAGVPQPYFAGRMYDAVVVEEASPQPGAYSTGASQMSASVVVRFQLVP